MAIAFVQAANAQVNSASTITATIAAAKTGNILVVINGSAAVQSNSPTCTGYTFSLLSDQAFSGAQHQMMWVSTVLGTGTSVQITAASALGGCLSVLEFSGLGVLLDQANSGSVSSTSPVSTASITTIKPNDLVLTFAHSVAATSGPNWTAPGGAWTTVNNVATGTSNWGQITNYQIANPAGTFSLNQAFSAGGTTACAASIFSILQADQRARFLRMPLGV